MFTRCRNILKTVKNVTVAKFELAFTRCRKNLKTVRKLTVKTRCKTLTARKCTYTLRTNHPCSKSVEKCSVSSLSRVNKMSFSKCSGKSSVFQKSTVFKICCLPAKNVPFSCKREAYPSHFFTVSKMCWHRVNALQDSP